MPKELTKQNQKKPSSKTRVGLFPKFLSALKERYHHVLQVIDDALASDNLKDRIWAVEQILKRTKPEVQPEATSASAKELKKSIKKIQLDSKTISAMTDQELLAAIQKVLSSEEGDAL